MKSAPGTGDGRPSARMDGASLTTDPPVRGLTGTAGPDGPRWRPPCWVTVLNGRKCCPAAEAAARSGSSSPCSSVYITTCPRSTRTLPASELRRADALAPANEKAVTIASPATSSSNWTPREPPARAAAAKDGRLARRLGEMGMPPGPAASTFHPGLTSRSEFGPAAPNTHIERVGRARNGYQEQNGDTAAAQAAYPKHA